jgi:hypothetical protein
MLRLCNTHDQFRVVDNQNGGSSLPRAIAVAYLAIAQLLTNKIGTYNFCGAHDAS